MIYFIPNWQSLSVGPTDFDDIVHQLKMFQENGVAVELLLPTYLPNIRYQLSKQGLDNIKYWSVFDYLQNVENVVGLPMTLDALNFPKNTEFIYTPTCTIAMVSDVTVAKIYYSEFGFVNQVVYFKNNIMVKKIIFDDRGFASSSIFFDNGIKTKINYFDDQNNIKIQQNILPNQLSTESLSETVSFNSMEDLIINSLEKHLQRNIGQHTLIISASLHNNYLTKLSSLNYRMIISFFSNRFDFENKDALRKYLSVANAVVVDTRFSKSRVEEAYKFEKIENNQFTLQELPPFDTKLKLGDSQSSKLYKIYWYIDDIPAEQSAIVTQVLIDNILEKKNLSLLITSHSREKINSAMQQMFLFTKKFYQVNEDSFIYQSAWNEMNDDSENKLTSSELENIEGMQEWQDAVEAISMMQRLEGKLIISEHDVITGLQNARIVLDLNQTLDVYLQISSLSVGLPQINMRESPYVIQEKNGMIITDVNQLEDALAYYLDILQHWNEALVYNVAQIEKYSGKNNVQRWIQLVEGKYEEN
ncbi:MAG: accessory Sec system protein Asp1 [Leuconostoc gelidum]|jgi:accessory secretory protein Asp1|uniref:accessory Sec system protein Asp1 n=1 Tax=Leuconostoc gelidum TaxID=1244 RepID=UPI001575FC6E|nr:accessory Sec system protein Asp1 [Leuconostoc gelidum]MBZ5979106.1 accessory Sec system protein Asp1 [Leuconostoc gelidum subsp. gelidum]MBZ6001956.1 accessory Sec system protein Asp1 [Leuconostoc gelidum subsp. gelidum]QDJ30373.1 accessory Sec system protein Asp1 [Leuconostoc gelidum subsp. gelidum]